MVSVSIYTQQDNESTLYLYLHDSKVNGSDTN